MPRLGKYVLPLLCVCSGILMYRGSLHLGYLHIKSYELQWPVDQEQGSQHRQPQVTPVKAQHLYEDGVLSWRPNYSYMLEADLAEIAAERDMIDSIDACDMSFYTSKYRVQSHIKDDQLRIIDTTFAKAVASVDLECHLAIYDRYTDQLLYTAEDRKVRIKNSIVFRGFAPRQLMENKVKEILLAQISTNIPDLIDIYEAPHMQRAQKIKLIKALLAWYGKHDMDNLDEEAELILWTWIMIDTSDKMTALYSSSRSTAS